MSLNEADFCKHVMELNEDKELLVKYGVKDKKGKARW